MDNIDKEAYAGRWYIVLRDDDKNPMYFARCNTKEFKMLEDGTMAVHAQGHTGIEKYDKKGFDANLWRCGTQPGHATCMVKNINWKTTEYTYTLLGTDYANYDVYYFCFPFAYNSMHYQFVIVGSRTPQMPQGEKLDEIKRIIKDKVPEYDIDSYTGFNNHVQEDWCGDYYHWKWGEDEYHLPKEVEL